MAFIDKVLETPAYGWQTETGELMIPTTRQLLNESLRRVNLFKDKRNWMSAICWIMMACMLPFVYFFVTHYFSFWTAIAFLLYTMIVMGTHGTIWFHRYCTHHSFSFGSKLWRIITQNLVIKTFPEEIYVISHHVHHAKSDQPGDPYNARGGFLYCLLSYVNHQSVQKNLTEAEYAKAAHFMRHTGVAINSYPSYLRWGSITRPSYTIALWLMNWAVWYGLLFLIGGHALACALFSAAFSWFLLVPLFNYTGHGKGELKHRDGLDFDRRNLSINQWRPGYFAGEWHNNHHLYPASARCGFMPWQLDMPWLYVKLLHRLGGVKSYRDSTKDFFTKYVTPGTHMKCEKLTAVLKSEQKGISNYE